MRWFAGCCGLSMAVGMGCTDGASTLLSGVTSEDEAPQTTAETVEAPPVQEPMQPRIQVVGPPGVVPTQIAVHTGERFFSILRALSDQNEIIIQPPVSGHLERLDDESMAFVPDEGFAPGTDYTVSVPALVDGEHVETGPWTHAFSTPEFGLARVTLHRHSRENGLTEVDLVFAAPVDPQNVQRRVRFSQGGRPLFGTVQPSDRPEEVRFRFFTARNATLPVQVSLTEGVSWIGDDAVRAAEARHEVSLQQGPPVHILATKLKEGMSGFYLDVYCKDESVDGEHHVWDRESWEGWWVSSRCLLDSEALTRSVRVYPEVDLTLVPAEGGFRLFGDFQRGDYTLEIDAGTGTVDGGVLDTAHRFNFSVGARRPRIQFASRGRYLPRESWDQLAVRHLNVGVLTLTVRHVPPQNMIFWMSGADEDATERTANVLLSDAIPVANPLDQETTTWLDVGRLLPDAQQGIYELSVVGSEEMDVARLLLTNLHMVAKRMPSRDGVQQTQVWVLDAHNGAPVSGASVSLVQPSGREVSTCTTTLGGDCLLSHTLESLNDAPPMAIIAELGDDLTYLKFSELAITPETDVSGQPFGGEQAYSAALMTERGVYRPGETVHLSVIARDADHHAPANPLPIVLRVFDAWGREIRHIQRETNAAGIFTEDISLAAGAITGRYTVRAEVAEKHLDSTSFLVESFVPERMAASVQIVDGEARSGTETAVEIGARWLFGGTAKGSRVELSCLFEEAPFVPAQNATHHYGPALLTDTQAAPVLLGVVEGVLDGEGQAQLRCPATAADMARAGRLVSRVAVFEGDSGRSTVSTDSAPLHPAEHYLGLRAAVDTATRGEAVDVSGVVVDWDGALAPAAVSDVAVEIVRLEEEIGWVWDEQVGRSIRRQQLRRIQEASQTVQAANGAFQLSFTPEESAAGYLVVVRAEGAETALHIPGDGQRYWWDFSEQGLEHTPRPERPTPLEIQVPETVRVGEAITVSTQVPYDGRLLWSVETDGVQHAEWQVVQAGEASWTVAVDEFSPNVYVAALLIKDAHLESRDAYIPDRAFGVSSVRVLPEQFLHTVSLETPDVILPNSTLTVQVSVEGAEGPTFATVAAVDEGILQLTQFADPDPSQMLFAQRALGVETFETVGWSLASSGGPGSRTGGDVGGVDSAPLSVRPVALWSGLVEVNADGTAEVELAVPGYRGQLRVMAVTADARHVGMASASVTVQDPLVLQTTLPRFLVEGDQADVPVFVSNMTGADGTFDVSIAVEALEGDVEGAAPAVQVVGPSTQQISLAAEAAGSVVFRLRADVAMAAARITVTAAGNDQTSFDAVDVTVAPALARVSRSTHVAVAPGQQIDLSTYLAGWEAYTDRSTVWLSANPYGGTFRHLRYLLDYPYGCLEQTTSATRPLLFASSLLGNVDPSLPTGPDVDALIAHGIERVTMMQTVAGGFAYWPGGTHPVLWASAYATHMLLDAADQGHDVAPDVLNNALAWLSAQVDNPQNMRGAAYAHYVLARAEQGRSADAQRLLENLQDDERESRLLLMAALQRAGVRTHEAELKQPDLTPIRNLRDNDWSFYSDRRRRALNLNIIEELFPGDASAEPLAALVAASLEGGESYWYTTQELAWAVSGLGRRIERQNQDLTSAVLLANQQPLDALTQGAQGNSWRLKSVFAYGALSLDVPASDQPLYLHLMTEGVPANEPPPYGNQGLLLTRSYLNGLGEPIDPTQHDLGDLIYVKLTLQNVYGAPVQNIALVDRLPAGWEIEQPNLGRGALPDWAQSLDLWAQEHVNRRDDRLEVFGALNDGDEHAVVYAVRAVTAGSFIQPPISAEAMYETRVWARQPGMEMEITGPWAAAF